MGSSTLNYFTFCLIGITVNKVSSSQELMHKLTSEFTKVFEKCKNELNLDDQVIQDFYNFWREDYQLLNRELGCMVLCMGAKFDLVNGDMKLHHDNTHEFAKAHGADDEVAKKLVTMIHDCEVLHQGITDHCSRILEMSKCFRTKINDLKWTPSMEVIVEEVMAMI